MGSKVPWSNLEWQVLRRQSRSVDQSENPATTGVSKQLEGRAKESVVHLPSHTSRYFRLGLLKTRGPPRLLYTSGTKDRLGDSAGWLGASGDGGLTERRQLVWQENLETKGVFLGGTDKTRWHRKRLCSLALLHMLASSLFWPRGTGGYKMIQLSA